VLTNEEPRSARRMKFRVWRQYASHAHRKTRPSNTWIASATALLDAEQRASLADFITLDRSPGWPLFSSQLPAKSCTPRQ